MSKVDQSPRTVWIGYQEDSYEGCSEPLVVFSSKFLAEIWLSGATASGACRCKILELPVIDAALREDGR